MCVCVSVCVICIPLELFEDLVLGRGGSGEDMEEAFWADLDVW